MTEVDYKYARGLLEVSREGSRTGAFKSGMQSFLEVLCSSPELQSVLASPDTGSDTKKRIVARLFSQNMDSGLLSFIMLVIDKGRENRLQSIAKAFIGLADRDMGIVTALVTTARALEKEERDLLREELSRTFGGTVEIENRIDEGILGGIVVHIGDKLLDGSLRGRLNAIKSIIYEAAAGRTGMMKNDGPQA